MKRTMAIGLALALLGLPMTARADDGQEVARGSCGGTWVITPSAVAGKQPVHFVGNTAPDGGQRTHAAATPPNQK